MNLPIGKVDIEEFDVVERVPVYTTAFPRSGTTWTNRLLSDLLDAPMQTQPGAEVQYWGDKYDGEFVIRKTHSIDSLPGKAIYIQRDPRDVCTSVMHYRNLTSIQDVLENRNTHAKFMKFGDYETFVRTWLPRVDNKQVVMIWYEELHESPAYTLYGIIKWLELDWDSDEIEYRISTAIQRQSFDTALARLGDPHSMWKGKIGTWREYFTVESGKEFNSQLGPLMLELGYIDTLDWWKEL